MWPDDGLELWERDGYAEAMYEKADNDRKASRENAGQRPSAAPDGVSVPRVYALPPAPIPMAHGCWRCGEPFEKHVGEELRCP